MILGAKVNRNRSAITEGKKGRPMRVLLIEDEPSTARAIELMLTTEGFNVYTTDLGEEGLDLGKLYDYDIILLDLNLPDMHGYDVLKKLRVSKVQTPVLVLSGISEVDSKVYSFGFGADDYVTKPFHREELVARIHAVVRRSKGHSQSVIRTGKLAMNLDSKTAEVGGARVHLTGKEYAMLELLALRKGTTITKDMFLNHLYGGMDEPELKIIDVFVCKIRSKVGEDFIETSWGHGYRLTPSGMSQVTEVLGAESGQIERAEVQPRPVIQKCRRQASIIAALARHGPMDINALHDCLPDYEQVTKHRIHNALSGARRSRRVHVVDWRPGEDGLRRSIYEATPQGVGYVRLHAPSLLDIPA